MRPLPDFVLYMTHLKKKRVRCTFLSTKKIVIKELNSSSSKAAVVSRQVSQRQRMGGGSLNLTDTFSLLFPISVD